MCSPAVKPSPENVAIWLAGMSTCGRCPVASSMQRHGSRGRRGNRIDVSLDSIQDLEPRAVLGVHVPEIHLFTDRRVEVAGVGHVVPAATVDRDERLAEARRRREQIDGGNGLGRRAEEGACERESGHRIAFIDGGDIRLLREPRRELCARVLLVELDVPPAMQEGSIQGPDRHLRDRRVQPVIQPRAPEGEERRDPRIGGGSRDSIEERILDREAEIGHACADLAHARP
jgi:hypothetical protein